MEKKIIGILGGMGPLATADLFRKIIDLTEAAKDQDHVRVIIDSNTDIPDRTAAILHNGADPVPALTESAVLLEKAGAGFLIMPCNTAHYFYQKVQAAVSIPVISIIEETAKKVKELGYDTVLILATDGTIQSKVYEKVFDAYGIRSVYPDPETQKGVMDIIYKGVKAGITDLSGTDETAALLKKDTARLNSFIKKTSEKFGGKVVAALACTELPMAKECYGFEGTFTDPTENLAKAAVRAAGYCVKE